MKKPTAPPPPQHPGSIQASLRRAALEVCLDWQKTGRYATDLLDERIKRTGLSGPNAAFLHDIVLTTLRHLSQLDHWADQLTSGKKLDAHARWSLRTGLCQLLILGVPAHAAVNETVAAAGRAGALVNAVLRRAAREQAALKSQPHTLPLSIQHSHPEWLTRRWIKIMGKDKAQALCEWNQQPAPVFVRLNRLHDEAAAILPHCAGLQPFGEDGHFFECTDGPPREALRLGLCYAQDPATAHAPLMLAPQPGETVLDACAAPGGKTGLLAQLMRNEGQLIACDSSPARLIRLRENLTRLKVRCAQIIEHDMLSTRPPPFAGQHFDRILLDVPCSNTGVMRRRVDVRWRLREEDFAAHAQAQLRIATAALPFLKIGGSLVYSTCSLDPEENQHVVKALLAAHPSLELLESRLVFPPKDGTDGAYAARLVRQS